MSHELSKKKEKRKKGFGKIIFSPLFIEEREKRSEVVSRMEALKNNNLAWGLVTNRGEVSAKCH